MLNPFVKYLGVLWNVLLLRSLAWYLRSLAVFGVENMFTNKRSFQASCLETLGNHDSTSLNKTNSTKKAVAL